MLRRLLIGVLALALVPIVPAASADEPLGKGFEGAFELQGTHGYRIEGWIGSLGKGTAGLLALIVSHRGGDALYSVRGEVTAEHAHFNLGSLGRVDVEVKPTGGTETVQSECGGKPQTINGAEYVGTIEFRGEGGYTSAQATGAPLEFQPLLDLLCPGYTAGITSGEGLPGVRIKVKHAGGPTMELDQNHRGAPIFYGAHTAEVHGGIRISRSVSGHLGSGALRYEPSLGSASFSAGAPFSGTATYAGTKAPRRARPGKGAWRGDLTVDFPGAPGVRLAGPGFSASIVHAHRTESRG